MLQRAGQNLGLMVALMKMLALAVVGTARPTSTSLPTMNDFLVTGLHEIEPEYAKFEGTMYAGLLPMDNGHDDNRRKGELMFWFFAPNQPLEPNTVTVWLNGGPGCSSFNGGVMFEHSPVTVPLRPAGYCCSQPNEPLVYNPHAWTQVTNMLYVEQPVGVGFSRGGPEPQIEADLVDDFFAFLQNWFHVFEPYQSAKLFLLGESYAGYYVPAIAHKINQEMQSLDASMKKKQKKHHAEEEQQPGLIRLHLEGVGLGNGWTDAMVQGPATIDYGYWHGFYDEHTRQALHAEWDHCVSSSKKEPEPDPFHKFTPPDDCAMMVGDLMAGGRGVWQENLQGPNTYDVTTWDPYPVILGGANSTIDAFFNDPRVKEKLHAPQDVQWAGCIPGAGRRRRRQSRRLQQQEGRRILSLLDNDKPLSTVPYLGEMLDAGIRVLIYNGDRDLSTCAQGSEMTLNGMQWSGSEGWFQAPRGLWVNPNHSHNDMPAGYAKSHKGLDFVVVYNSGHLVPYNQPENALDLISRFIRNESFHDYPLPDFDFYHHTVNPGTSLANGMYPINNNDKHFKVQQERERGLHFDVWIVLLAMACSFVAGIFTSLYFLRGRAGYQKL